MNNNNAWEPCPICKGSGEITLPKFTVPSDFTKGMQGDSTSWLHCSVCKGKKIISKLTGKPPQD